MDGIETLSLSRSLLDITLSALAADSLSLWIRGLWMVAPFIDVLRMANPTIVSIAVILGVAAWDYVESFDSDAGSYIRHADEEIREALSSCAAAADVI